MSVVRCRHLWRYSRAVYLLLCGMGVMGIPMSAPAQIDATYLFDIPRLRADKALIQFARQTKITVLFPYEQVKRVRAGPLRGAFTVSEALEVLLQGSGIGWNDESTSETELETSNNETGLLLTGENSMNNLKSKLVPTVIALSVLGGKYQVLIRFWRKLLPSEPEVPNPALRLTHRCRWTLFPVKISPLWEIPQISPITLKHLSRLTLQPRLPLTAARLYDQSRFEVWRQTKHWY